MLASRFGRTAIVAVGALLLLVGTSSALAAEKRKRGAGTILGGSAPLLKATDASADSAPARRLLATGALAARDPFSPLGTITTLHHGGEDGHLPPVEENIELVGELQMSTPDELRVPGSEDIPVLPEQIADLSIHKGYAYLNSWDDPTCARGGTFIVDINDPTEPEQVGFLPALEGRYHGEGAHVVTLNTPVFQGDLLAVNNEPYTTAGCSDNLSLNGGVDLYDVTDPENPETFVQGLGDTGPEGELEGSDPSAHSSHSAFVWQGADRRAYIVFVDNVELHDVDIYEITDPANPQPVGEFDLVELADEQGFDIVDNSALGETILHHDVVVKNIGGRFVMLVDYWDAGYVTLDVTNPANPRYIADTSFDGPDPLTGYDPPEGNAHQAEFSHDNRFIVAADEDFNQCRFDARIVDGPNADTPLVAAEAPDLPSLCPDIDLEGATRYVGRACTADGPLPAPDAAHTIALVVRGVCGFQEKYDNVVAAGYDAGLVFNSNTSNAGCQALVGMLIEPNGTNDIPFLFIPRVLGFQILDEYDPGSYVCTADANTADDTPDPTPPIDGATIRADPEFDGWGYAHLYEARTDPNNPGKMERIDSYAIPEALNPAFANGFGDLSIHEFATDPDQYIAYSSYYSGGMRVFTFNDGGIRERGRWIDEEGSNFWGVEQFTTASGERLFAGSDRDFGLQIFRYTGPKPPPPPNQKPVCRDVTVMVPFKGSASVPLSCSDEEGSPLTLSAVRGPSAGTVTLGLPTGTYQHTGSVLGAAADSFVFRASDGTDSSNDATVTIVTGARDGGRCFNPFAGTAAADNLAGSPFGDSLNGGDGNDLLIGLAGDDCLLGANGRDELQGNAGADTLEGGAAADQLSGNQGADTLEGEAGNDRGTGGSGNDRASGGSGRDRLSGGSGRDRLSGNGGNDRLDAGSGRRNTLSGGRGRDTLLAVNGRRDRIRCGRGRDSVRADRNDRVGRDCERVRRARRR